MRVMAQSPLTRELSAADYRELDSFVTAWSWAAGDPIIFAGEDIEGSYMIVAGRARVTRDTAEGREITVDIAVPGDVIGPLSTHAAPSPDSAWAMETTCALYLPAHALATVVHRLPQFALSLLSLQQQMVNRSRTSHTDSATVPVEQRVAAALLYLNSKLGQRQRGGSFLLQARLRRDDIAGLAATTVESTSRVMSRLKKDGLIDAGREWISLRDVPKLTTLAAGT